MAAPHSFPEAMKRDMRSAALARRAGAPDVGPALAANVLASGLLAPGQAVAGFWPLPGEIDLVPLLHALHARGHAVLLPETPPRGQPLRFRNWAPGAAMVSERFGTQRPDGPLAVPDALLVPLLAFDARCNRLGYGGGYYDRTIASLPGILTIGCAFAMQRVDDVPVLPHDVPLDAIVTEHGVLRRPV